MKYRIIQYKDGFGNDVYRVQYHDGGKQHKSMLPKRKDIDAV